MGANQTSYEIWLSCLAFNAAPRKFINNEFIDKIANMRIWICFVCCIYVHKLCSGCTHNLNIFSSKLALPFKFEKNL